MWIVLRKETFSVKSLYAILEMESSTSFSNRGHLKSWVSI